MVIGAVKFNATIGGRSGVLRHELAARATNALGQPDDA